MVLTLEGGWEIPCDTEAKREFKTLELDLANCSIKQQI
jgi:hypothetical protein